MAWWLAYEELYGDMDKTYPIKGVSMSDVNLDDTGRSDYWYDYTRNDPNAKNPFTDPKDKERAEKFIYESPDGGKTVYQRPFGEHDPTKRTRIKEEYDVPKQDSVYPVKLKDDCYPTLGSIPGVKEPSINKKQIRKYEEDKGIKDLQDYISTTYGGHYTSEHNNVQTLDLIESVGDAESFCRSNAIKYLSRYDKKGQAKRDILKALHYTLLLYYFSGNTNDEITTRGYETF
tara:strand:- start:325 stop:1017 length:693 start_codon:yes stop_codon:yes gene_type:complete